MSYLFKFIYYFKNYFIYLGLFILVLKIKSRKHIMCIDEIAIHIKIYLNEIPFQTLLKSSSNLLTCF
jgi:hypothetical protein